MNPSKSHLGSKKNNKMINLSQPANKIKQNNSIIIITQLINESTRFNNTVAIIGQRTTCLSYAKALILLSEIKIKKGGGFKYSNVNFYASTIERLNNPSKFSKKTN